VTARDILRHHRHPETPVVLARNLGRPDETLRVNGQARLRDEAEFTRRFAEGRQPPKLVIEVRVQEAYLHCAKAFMRSRLWRPEAQQPRSVLPTLGEMLHDQIGLATAPESQAQMVARYQAQLQQEGLG
jgi:hypothetical protein